MKCWLVLVGLALVVACDSNPPSETPDTGLVLDAGTFDDARVPDASSDAGEVMPRSAPLPPVSGGTMTVAGFRVLVADPDRDALFVFRLPALDGTLERTIALEPGDEPGRMVPLDEERVLVVLRGAGALATIDFVNGTVERLDTCANPRGVDVSADGIIYATCAGGSFITIDGSRTTTSILEPDLRDVVVEGDHLYVSLLRSAEVLVLDRASLEIVDRLVPSNADGLPNSAWRMRAAPEGGVLLLHQVSSQDPIVVERGGYGAMTVCGPAGVVQTAYSHLQVGEAPITQTLIFAVMGVDFAVLPDGSVGIASAGATGLARTSGVTRYPIAEGDCASPEFDDLTTRPAHSIEAVGDQLVAWLPETASLRIGFDRDVESGAEVLGNPGRTLFHAGTPAFVACASCHPEGRDDGVTWNFVPTGLRRTQSLIGGLLDTAPFHWDGDQADMSAIMEGSFTERMGGGTLEPEQVEAISQWLEMLPGVARDVATDADTLAAGAAAFESAACTDCHAGAALTNNANMDVGTDGSFQVPSLRGVSMRAPYLHDGRAVSLEEAVAQHADLTSLSTDERSALIAHLETL